MTKGQRGFLFDAGRCVLCHACEVACQAAHGLSPQMQWRKVVEVWEGHFPAVTRTFVSISCLHCAEPPCQRACPSGAISKRTENGVVVVDGQLCTGCRECYEACPRRVPQFGADGVMGKCDLCLDRAAPACAAACPTAALRSGTMAELADLARKRGGKRLAGAEGPALFVCGPQIPVELMRLP